MAPLSHILNLSFKTGYIPTCMKTAVIKPIFKKGKPDEFTNYRPISLLSSFSKLLEKIAANQMMKFLNKFKILYEHQYGFRSGYNTTQPVIHFIDKISKALNNPEENQVSLAIFIDLTKAFDTCDINILLHKLENYGFRGISNIWFKNYLTGRYQYTSIRGVNSSLKEMSCGVPQGSILGPILFILLINDLPNASKLFSILYADDTTLIKSGSNISQLFEIANIELNKLADWFKANRLTLNTSKTKYILFRHKYLAVNFSKITLKIENETIDRIGAGCQEESFKFVGIHLDEFLSWEFHSRKIRAKISGAVYALSKLKSLLPKKIKYLIYNSLFRSHIEYCISAWGKSKSSEIKRIITLQKRAVRYIDNARYNSHTGPIFNKYRILRFNDLVDFNQDCLLYNNVNGRLPTSFRNMFEKLSNFERSLSFKSPILKHFQLNHLSTFSMISLWNKLPLELKRKKSLNIFKSEYSRLLFTNYNLPCNNPRCYTCKN